MEGSAGRSRLWWTSDTTLLRTRFALDMAVCWGIAVMLITLEGVQYEYCTPTVMYITCAISVDGTAFVFVLGRDSYANMSWLLHITSGVQSP